jgi:hypothetical protein
MFWTRVGGFVEVFKLLVIPETRCAAVMACVMVVPVGVT